MSPTLRATAPAAIAGSALAAVPCSTTLGVSAELRCRTDPLPDGWPQLEVVAFSFSQQGRLPDAQRRDAARRRLREVLSERGGDALAAELRDAPLRQRGGRSVSVAHDATVSLLAWCRIGALGVDVVELEALEAAGRDELTATAALYLGPAAALAVAASGDSARAARCFALRWAAMEARLKCLGMELDEWSLARERQIAAVGCVHITQVDGGDLAAGSWVGAAAWRAGERTRSS